MPLDAQGREPWDKNYKKGSLRDGIRKARGGRGLGRGKGKGHHYGWDKDNPDFPGKERAGYKPVKPRGSSSGTMKPPPSNPIVRPQAPPPTKPPTTSTSSTPGKLIPLPYIKPSSETPKSMGLGPISGSTSGRVQYTNPVIRPGGSTTGGRVQYTNPVIRPGGTSGSTGGRVQLTPFNKARTSALAKTMLARRSGASR